MTDPRLAHYDPQAVEQIEDEVLLMLDMARETRVDELIALLDRVEDDEQLRDMKAVIYCQDRIVAYLMVLRQIAGRGASSDFLDRIHAAFAVDEL